MKSNTTQPALKEEQYFTLLPQGDTTPTALLRQELN